MLYDYLQMASDLIKSNEQSSRVPYNRLIYGLSAPESKRQYPKRLEVFLNFIDMDDGYSLEERLYKLYQRAKSNTEWLQDTLIDFIIFKKEEYQKVKSKIQLYRTITNQ